MIPQRLIEVPIEALKPHPANPNIMDQRLLAKLTENIRRNDDYPPLIVRPHPTEAEAFQLLDGHQRLEVLRRLSKVTARCYLWPCSDADALLLLIASLNRLHGEDEPARRADLLHQLSELLPISDLAALLPEDEGDIQRALEMIDIDLDAVLRDLVAAGPATDGLKTISFALSAEQAERVELAVRQASDGLEGRNKRGRALDLIAEHYLETGQ